MRASLPDLHPVLERYEALAGEADAAFAAAREKHPDCVVCREGCGDCCYALFDLSLVEAVFLHTAFLRVFPGGEARSALLERADAADRRTCVIKKRAYGNIRDGAAEESVLADVARERVRCPLLDAADRCLLYDARPITCRLYGIPASINGKAHVCGRSRFAVGGAYATVSPDVIRKRLAALSFDLSLLAGGRRAAVHTVLVPLSTALLTDYDAGYFGVVPPEAACAETGCV